MNIQENQRQRLAHIVILNGEIAGDMAAAALARQLAHTPIKITIIDLERDETPFCFGSAFPSLVNFHHMLRLDERLFLQETGGAFKLSARYEGVGAAPYHHAYGPGGPSLNGHGFHHHFITHAMNPATGNLPGAYHDYCFAARAAREGKFALPQAMGKAAPPPFSYTYHFDMARYSRLLNHYADQLSVTRINGAFASAAQDTASGFLKSIRLTDGRQIDGDLFLDCSGQKALLLDETLGAQSKKAGHIAPCDRVLLAQASHANNTRPLYTAMTAGAAGWHWRIPMAGHIDVGYAYNSAAQTRSAALREFMNASGVSENAVTAKSTAPRIRTDYWRSNCIALGDAAGAIEPFEGMHLHLIQSGLARLITLMPAQRTMMKTEADEYNRLMSAEFDCARDYMQAHYTLNKRSDTPFWRDQRATPLSSSLSRIITQFSSRGRFSPRDHDPFLEESWLSLLFGHDILPDRFTPLLEGQGQKMTADALQSIRQKLTAAAKALPTHEDFLSHYLSDKTGAADG